MARILVLANGGDGYSPRSSRSSPDRESSVESSVGGSEGGIASLRGVQWRIKLEVLPETTSIDELRRAAANGRRKTSMAGCGPLVIELIGLLLRKDSRIQSSAQTSQRGL